MAKTNPRDFQKTAATGVNSDVFDINIDEGALTASLNDALRGMGGVLAAPSDFGDAVDAIKIDNIVESTPGAGVTVDGLNIKDGGIAGPVALETVTVTGGVVMSASAVDRALGSAVASAATTDIWVTDGNSAHVTGTALITSLGTAAQAGATRSVVFDGAATLTNGANLILPGGADIVTAAGDSMAVLAETTAQARVVSYTKADGTAIVATVFDPAQLCQFWVKFNSSGGIDASYNAASVVQNSTGNYTANLTTPFATANWCATLGYDSSGSLESTTMRIIAQTASSITVLCENNGGVALDVDAGYVAGFGAQ